MEHADFICPHCDAHIEKWIETEECYEDSEIETECSNCEKPIVIVVSFSICFDAHKKEDED